MNTEQPFEWKARILSNVVGKSPYLSETTFFTLWAYQHTYAIKEVMRDYGMDPDNGKDFYDMAIYIYEENPELIEECRN